MTARHAPAPTYPSRLWLGLMAAAVAGIVVPPTVLAARAVAPQVAAAERLALTPERPAEPSAHGGPLAPLSIGVVAPERDVPVVPPIVRSSRPPQRPQEALGTPRGSTDTQTALTGAPSDKPAAATTTPEPTTTPPTTTVAATTTTTAPATTTRTCHRWRCHSWPTTTTETTTAATTTAATETTSEPSDPLATLLSDVLEGQ